MYKVWMAVRESNSNAGLESATGFAALCSVAPMHPVGANPARRPDFSLKNLLSENHLLEMSLIEAN